MWAPNTAGARRSALRACLVLASATFAHPAKAEPSGEAPVTVEVVGRLTVEWTARGPTSDGRERFGGILLDELGDPVSGAFVVTDQPGAQLSPCIGATTLGSLRVETTHDGHFCFIAGSFTGDLTLRAEARHHEPVSVTAPRPSSLGPRILRAPRSVDLDSNTSATFEILPIATSRGGRVALYVECGRGLVRLHDAPTDRGLVRAEVEPKRIPGPGACTVLAEQLPSDPASANGTLRSRPHPLLAVAKATLAVDATSVEGGVTNVTLAITAGPEQKKLDAGVIEVWQGDAFVASAPIDDGEATVAIPHGQRRAMARISLADGGPGVVSGAPLELPIAALEPGTSRSALVGWMVFGALGVWLVWLWLGRDRRAPSPSDSSALGPGVDFEPPARGGRAERLAGRVTDAYTAEPLAGVRIFLEAPEATRVRLVAETLSEEDGSFRFDERVEPASTRRLRFEREGYVTQEGRITQARVAARLVSLRHALLGALHARGSHVTKRPARITPSELARIAAHHGNAQLANWALAIERAVYGPSTPSHESARLLLAADAGSLDERPGNEAGDRLPPPGARADDPRR